MSVSKEEEEAFLLHFFLFPQQQLFLNFTQQPPFLKMKNQKFF